VDSGRPEEGRKALGKEKKKEKGKETLKKKDLSLEEKKEKEENICAALKLALDNTQRLRTQSNGKWTMAMSRFVEDASIKKNVPLTTLKRRFKRQLEAETSGKTEVEQQKTKKKKRADARSHLTGAEKKVVYDWIEYMRQNYFPPTRLEVRFQVLVQDKIEE
jgi:hypothetical protein